jgi:hypothetical protein
MVCRRIRNTFLSCAQLFSLAGFSATAQSQDKKPAHLAGSNPVSGVQLYKRYCAVCHGYDLKGNGRVSPESRPSSRIRRRTSPRSPNVTKENSQTNTSRMYCETV